MKAAISPRFTGLFGIEAGEQPGVGLASGPLGRHGGAHGDTELVSGCDPGVCGSWLRGPGIGEVVVGIASVPAAPSLIAPVLSIVTAGEAWASMLTRMTAMSARLTVPLGSYMVADLPAMMPAAANWLMASWAPAGASPMSVKPSSIAASRVSPAGPAARAMNRAICQRETVSFGL